MANDEPLTASERDACLDIQAERDMGKAYYEALETHLRAHGCDHDFSDAAENPDEDAKVLAARSQAAEAGELDVGRLREALESMINQFAYWSDGKKPGLWTGGLSALEEAFAALGWTDPYPAPWRQCDEPGCRKQSSAGTPTLNGYRRTCHEHMPMEAHEAWQAAWRASGLSYSEFAQQQKARLATASAEEAASEGVPPEEGA